MKVTIINESDERILAEHENISYLTMATHVEVENCKWVDLMMLENSRDEKSQMEHKYYYTFFKDVNIKLGGGK